MMLSTSSQPKPAPPARPAGRRGGVADRRDVGVEDPPPVGHHRQRRVQIDRDTGRHARRNVEIAAVLEQAGIVVELGHVHLRLAGKETDPDVRRGVDLDTARCRRHRVIVAVIGQCGRVHRDRAEGAEPVGLEALEREGRRDTDRDVAEFLRVGGGGEELDQVDPGQTAMNTDSS
ncbi:MAG: hypothetical protein R3D80_08780 [Paracoccaceae bacterium]